MNFCPGLLCFLVRKHWISFSLYKHLLQSMLEDTNPQLNEIRLELRKGPHLATSGRDSGHYSHHYVDHAKQEVSYRHMQKL